MANQHLKRTSMPTSWPVKKKNITFIAKPNPGSHKMKYVVSMVVLLRDVLKYAATSKEVKRILHQEEVLINNKRVTDIKTAAGLFDIVEIKKTKEKYTVLFDESGKLKLVSAKDNLINLRVSRKTTTPGKKFQLNFLNGFNLLVDEKTFKSTKIADSVVYDLTKKKISSVLNLKEGNFVYLFDGKFKGQFAQIKSLVKYNGIARDLVEVEIEGNAHNTAKDYCYVIGTKKEDMKRFN